MFLLKIILQYVPKGFISWKYNFYFAVAEGEGEVFEYIGDRGDRGGETR